MYVGYKLWDYFTYNCNKSFIARVQTLHICAATALGAALLDHISRYNAADH